VNTSTVQPQAPWALRLLPPFPAIVHQILALANEEDAGANEVGRIIRLDPTFSVEVLRFANSALFGLRREVRSIPQAIAMLGMDRVKTIATFIAVHNMVGLSLRVPALRKVWVHSVVKAIIAEEAARSAGLDTEAAYTAGLLHNLGTLGLMTAYPDEYSRMLEVSNDFGFDLLQTERDLFEIDHCEAGSYLAEDWNLPAELAAIFATHHDEPVAKASGTGNIIKVSWRLADTLGYAAFSPDKERSFDEVISYLPAGHSWLFESADSARAELGVRLAASTF